MRTERRTTAGTLGDTGWIVAGTLRWEARPLPSHVPCYRQTSSALGAVTGTTHTWLREHSSSPGFRYGDSNYRDACGYRY